MSCAAGKMDGVLVILLLISLSVLLPHPSSSLPLCTDSRAPLIPKTPLAFCPYNGKSCCDSTKDLQLKKQFQAMNISDPGCASAIKSVLCAICDPFSGELYKLDSGPRPVPVLCNTTISATNSSQSKQVENDYCSNVWSACEDVPVTNSPFAPLLQGRSGVSQNSSSSKLTDLWQSKVDFCLAFGGADGDGSLCFDGEPVSLNDNETITPPEGLCLEKVGNGSYLNMVPHPDGSNRAFFSDQPGKVWLANLPEQDSGEGLVFDQSTPFVDLTDQVLYDTSFGMMGMAFHPNFANNGRFFASFNCDKVKSPECSGRCSCNSDVDCDPSKLGPSGAAQPCQYHIVIAEYSANNTASEPSKAKNAKPTEVRRIFTMGLPFTSNHGGQILFGPEDGYLYIMMGDGGSKGDPYNFAQNKKSLLGKIMRVDVDNMPSVTEINNLGLWGNYSIPRDNPYSDDKDLQPEIWALGLRNPWRCSFDLERPSYFMCADVGQDQYEEVNIITKAGNYGWRVYEGPTPFTPLQSPGGNTSVKSINPIFSVMGYSHSDINKKEGSAAISGGYFYRSTTDPCLYGSYLYGDLYAKAIWAAAETPNNSGNFSTTMIPFSCARESPSSCTSVPNSPLAALGYIYSFGEDNRKDVFILTSSGVYRVVRPSRCNYSCSKEKVTAIASSPPSSPSGSNQLRGPFKELVLFFSSILLLLGFIL